MAPDQAKQVLGWVNEMLSKNLRPQERERFFGAKQHLEGILTSQQRNQVGGLLSELMQMQNPNLFLGEGIVRAPGVPEGSYSPEHSRIEPEIIHPRDYRQPLNTIIRNILPNASWGDRMAINPDRFSPERVRRRVRGI